MGKLFTLIVRLAVLAGLAWIVWWAWQQYQAGGEPAPAVDVSEFDKICKITNPDFGSCVCTHRQTGERLAIPHKECVQRARRAE
jgi:hypothetical protein